MAALFPAFGWVLASVIERLDRSWPRHPASFLPLLLLVPAAPVGLVCLVIAGVALLVHQLDWPADARIGSALLGLAAMIGSVWTGAGIVSILG